jgi:opacity protein-like surface antigen
MMMRRTLCALVLAGGLLPSSALAQADSWQHKWYWGAQGGLMEFKTPTSTSWQQAYTAGGSWFITGRRSALYVAYDQVIFNDTTNSAVLDAASATGFQTLGFTRGRRIQAFLYAVPLDGWIQPYLGGGFAIDQITNAAPQNLTAITSNTELQSVLQTIDQTTTKAFPVFSGGMQLRFGALAVFGQYQFMPTGRNYLIDSAQHVFSVGLRYAVTGSREEVTTAR